MLKYSKKDTHREKELAFGKKAFYLQHGVNGYFVEVDGKKNIEMLVQNHTNPLNQGLLDKKAKFITNSGIFHLGNIIYVPNENQYYMAITEPSIGLVYSEYRIRPLVDTIKFKVDDVLVKEKAIMASGLLYEDKSYVNALNVFDDTDRKALIVQYNERTKNIKLLDDIMVNGRLFKVVQVDDTTLRPYNEGYGVLQLVVLSVPISRVEKVNILNGSFEEIRSVIRYARVKDKKLNSVAREFICEHQKIKCGDYIKYTFDSDDKGTMVEETYIVYNMPAKNLGYDSSIVYRCTNNFKIRNDNGDIVEVPYYFENTRTRIDRTKDSDYINQFNSSYMIAIQDNELTQKFISRQLSRLILKTTVYKITGVSDLDEGLIFIGLEIDKFNPVSDEYGIADYNAYKNELKYNVDKMYIKGVNSVFGGLKWKFSLSENNNQNHTIWSVSTSYVEIIESNDSECRISLRQNYKIGSTFRLIAKIEDIEVVKEIIIE